MIKALYIILALSFFAPVYTYVLYPFLLKLVTRFSIKEYEIDNKHRPYVSVLIAAYNEEKMIEEKILNLIKLDYPSDRIEFLIGSDGSSDKTVEFAKRYSHINNITIYDLPRGGKVNALNILLKKAKGEVLVFSDANTMYDPKAILELVKYFTDDRIGCVSGQLRYKIDGKSGQGAKSESTYWKYENWVKKLESKIGRLSGANGAIYAIRKGIISEIRKGIINDDFYVSTYVLQAGFDVIIEPNAIAYEEPNDEIDSQFKRHVRDGAGHYQALAFFWRMLFPRKGSFVFISHRVLRWLVPFFLLSALTCNALLVSQSLLMSILFAFQVVGYLTMILYYLPIRKGFKGKGIIIKVFNIVFYFLSVNLALLLGFLRLLMNRQKATWETQR